MIIARIAVIGAVLCSLFFNGSYAAAKANGHANQLAMVAVALSIDLCKCGFLTAASTMWREGQRLAPVVLVALWPMAFAYSLFAGYASVATNRATSSTTLQAQADARLRAEADYDQATAALNTAKTSSLWDASAACTAPKSKTQQTFCEKLTAAVATQQDAARKLDATTTVTTDPEVKLLTSNTQLSLETLTLLIVFAPACILELMSSVGVYAVNRRPPAKPRRTLSERFSPRWRGLRGRRTKNASERDSDALPKPAVPASAPTMVWPSIGSS